MFYAPHQKGMSGANMKLCVVRIQVADDAPEPVARPEEGEFIEKHLVPVKGLYSTLKGTHIDLTLALRCNHLFIVNLTSSLHDAPNLRLSEEGLHCRRTSGAFGCWSRTRPGRIRRAQNLGCISHSCVAILSGFMPPLCTTHCIDPNNLVQLWSTDETMLSENNTVR